MNIYPDSNTGRNDESSDNVFEQNSIENYWIAYIACDLILDSNQHKRTINLTVYEI